eukprot:2449138-Prymnesium_polylepis.1
MPGGSTTHVLATRCQVHVYAWGNQPTTVCEKGPPFEQRVAPLATILPPTFINPSHSVRVAAERASPCMARPVPHRPARPRATRRASHYTEVQSRPSDRSTIPRSSRRRALQWGCARRFIWHGMVCAGGLPQHVRSRHEGSRRKENPGAAHTKKM